MILIELYINYYQTDIESLDWTNKRMDKLMNACMHDERGVRECVYSFWTNFSVEWSKYFLYVQPI